MIPLYDDDTEFLGFFDDHEAVVDHEAQREELDQAVVK